MTEAAPDPTTQAVFNSLTLERGGVESLSALHVELCATVARLLASISAAPADDVPRLAETTSKLMAQLPPPVAAGAKPFDLAKLSDRDLAELGRLVAIATGEAEPVPDPVEPERTVGEAERVGRDLGAWIDERAERWRFGGPTEDEQIHLRNQFAYMGRNIITRNLWASIYRADMESEIGRAVKSALAAVGSDATIERPTPEEAQPRPVPSIHNAAGALSTPGIEAYSALFTGGGNRFDNRT